MTYLALDQAPSKVGFARGGADGAPPIWGVFKPSKRHPEASLRDWLQAQITLLGIRKVVYEQPFIGSRANPQNIIAMCGLPAIIRLACDDCDVPWEEAPLDVWRLHFFGVCRAPRKLSAHKRRQWLKDESMRACVERDWFVTKDDEADALGILDWALCRDFPQYGTDNSALFREMKGRAA